jgi:hypothetical protein
MQFLIQGSHKINSAVGRRIIYNWRAKKSTGQIMW